ncbi:hypothetical protein GQ457_15G028830 [Hibiscus cannabinus]
MDRSGAAAKEDGVTLFVFHLPEKLHWKGLWALFSYHGDVLDAYIPSKRSKGGQRFGFVRYASMEDAMRAQERLDGFPLYSYRVRVHLARFEPGRNHGRSRELWRIKNIESERGRAMEKTGTLRSVVGVVDPVKSDILKNCLVGWCSKFWRAGDLAKKLQEEGIKDASIMRLSGTIFLLIFKDHESLEGFLKEHEAALNKWFKNVKKWSEELSVCNRRACAWVSCQGIPIHAWNEETIGNIASLWGDLISVDERTVKPSSFYRAYFQILTNYSDPINETIELNVASKVFKVRVCEFEPAFTPNSVWCADEEESVSFTLDDAFEKQKLNAEFEGQVDESVESSTENLEVENEGEGEQSPRTDVAHLEATAVLSGKVLCQDEGVTNVTLNESERQLDLEGRSADIVAREKAADFAREDLEDSSAVSRFLWLRLQLLLTVVKAKDAQNINTANFQEQNDVGIATGVRTVDENSDFDSSPVEEDVRSLELGKHVAWADKVDRANSVNSASVLFPEMQDFHRRISKKYASMLDLQDKAISAKEKRSSD